MKPKTSIWDEWDVKGSEAVCKHCKRFKINRHATRCKAHTSSCSSVPNFIKKRYKEECLIASSKRVERMIDNSRALRRTDDDGMDVEDSSSVVSDSQSNTSNSQESGTTAAGSSAVAAEASATAAKQPFKKWKQTSFLQEKIVKVQKSDMNELQLLWGKALISGNIPFAWTSNSHLQHFFKRVREVTGFAYSLPSRKDIAGGILKQLHTESLEKMEACIETQRHLSVVPDGWTNTRNLSVINVMLANPEKVIFYKSFETGGNKETGAYIEENLLDVVDDIEGKYGPGKIVAIVSDQGSNFLSARKSIADSRGILSINCAAHMLNLLTGDIGKMPSIQTFINKCKAIVKDIKGSKRKLGQYYEEYNSWIQEEKSKGNTEKIQTLSIPSVTRWFAIRDMLSKLRKARKVLLRLSIRDDVDLKPSTRTTIKDENFWLKFQNIEPLFIALTDAIAKVESDGCCLSDVVEEFFKLEEIFSVDGSRKDLLVDSVYQTELTKCRKIFEKRRGLSNITKTHYLANLLDPRYRGKSFAQDEQLMISVLDELSWYSELVGIVSSEQEKEELGRQLSSYKGQEGIFGNKMLFNRVPHLYWENLRQFTGAKRLAEVGTRLLSIPASSASVERSFSIQHNIHTKTRNKLKEETVDKLMRVKWSLQEESLADLVQRKLEQKDEQPEQEEIELELEENDSEVELDELIQLDDPFSDSELLDI